MRFLLKTAKLRDCLLIAIPVLVLGGTLRNLSAQTPPRLNRDAVLNHLNDAITWYRDSTNKVHSAGLPSDTIYQDNTRNLASEAVRLAFQSARAEAALIDAGNKKPNANESSDASRQDFHQMAAKTSVEIDDTQAKLDSLNKQLPAAPRKKRQALLAQKDKLQGVLTLDKAVLEAIQKMANFSGTTGDVAGEGLEGSINQLARSAPEIFGNKNNSGATTSTPSPSAKSTQQQSNLANSTGLVGQSIMLLDRVRSMHDIDQLVKETERLRQTTESLREPLRKAIAATVQRGRDIANDADASGNTSTQDIRGEYQDLTDKFKQLSNATLPLSQELLLIEQARANFLQWRKSIAEESKDVLRALIIRIIGIAFALGLVLIVSEVWRRLTFRYIHDPRRLRQFLLLRRFVVGFLIGVVLILGFISEFSSLATFAGFVTAGIAVGLQAVLLSVAAYFFVVGRYGIRVGERISIAGVTGDVIDIGLVRLYLMELAGTGIDLYPTGRVVVFSNSVLFQAGTPLFKQIPGTEYSWHEVAVSLTPGGNYKAAQEKVSKAVDSVYNQYREDLEGQLKGIERDIEMQVQAPTPETKLQFVDNGLELVVRYPVDIRKASETDDHVTRALIDLVSQDAELKAAVGGTPKIRAAIKG
jgi:small-conductance mechanosensitive channel